MDRLFDVDGHGPKKSRILDQPDEKIQFEIFDKLSWPQLLTNFYEILTSCLPSYGVETLLTAFFRSGSYRPRKSVSVCLCYYYI